MLFSPTAQVNVGELVASTLNITDYDFRAKNYKFSGENGASVTNQGNINVTNGGYVALLGNQVRNEGLIVAKQGMVALGGGNAMTLDMHGDNLVRLIIDQGAVQALVENKNIIQADGGQVVMMARTANELARTTVNNSGIIQAKAINMVNGTIILDGGASSVVINSGTLDASGKDAGQIGGTVKVLGDKVGLVDSARIDVSGDKGGGTALIGGNYQGKGTEQNASQTVIGKKAEIIADALVTGNSGKVVVWADDITNFSGKISAMGGTKSGDGGVVETSGKKTLAMHGSVNGSAAQGKAGTWLLDPHDVNITSGTTGGTFDNGSPTNIFAAMGDNATVDAGAISLALAGTNVTITTGSDGAQLGNITVSSPISWNSDKVFTLKAYNDITINALI